LVAAERRPARRDRESGRADLPRLIRLELFKLRRRPMPKILLAILAGITFGVPWLFFLTLGGLGDEPAGVDRQEVLSRTVFPGALDASVENALSFGLPLLVVLTASAFGGEFAWGTVRLLLARGEGRGVYVLSKLAAILLWWMLALAIGSGTALVAATLIGLVDGEAGPSSLSTIEWLDFGGRLILAWAVSSVYAAVTALVTIQFRSTAIGLAIGLAAFYGETIVGGIAGGLGVAAFDLLARAGIAYNLRSMMGTLDGQENPIPLAALVLAMYTVGTTLAAIRHLRRHDVVVAGVG
jgi:ABC-type transport system involved in multi-copper enzyme maturation permease subunit